MVLEPNYNTVPYSGCNINVKFFQSAWALWVRQSALVNPRLDGVGHFFARLPDFVWLGLTEVVSRHLKL